MRNDDLNEELHNRNTELGRLSDDLINLLGSANLPIIMLGGDLRIRRFTPTAEKVLNLNPVNVGRPITDFNLGISLPDLESQVLEVINSRGKNGDYGSEELLSVQIRPYRTMKQVDGAAGLTDIDALKRHGKRRPLITLPSSNRSEPLLWIMI
jgi:two-component system CheB/CheR fusion protein